MGLQHLFGKKATRDAETAVFNVEGNKPENEVAAAIAMALRSNSDMAAIAMALCLCSDEWRDSESEVITLKNIDCTEWNSKGIKLLHSAYRR